MVKIVLIKLSTFLKNRNEYDFINLFERFNNKFKKYLLKHKMIENIKNIENN